MASKELERMGIYRCPYCGLNLAYKYGLVFHLNVHHKGQRYSR